LGVSIYFARPYHSLERGLNENTNGLIRQYFPKKMPQRNLSTEWVKKVQDILNHRPRKTLGYLTPHKVLVEGNRYGYKKRESYTYVLKSSRIRKKGFLTMNRISSILQKNWGWRPVW
jgi:response regulator of citrate/malate metabolism